MYNALDTTAAVQHIFFEPRPDYDQMYVWVVGVQEGDVYEDKGVLDDRAVAKLTEYDPDNLNIIVENGVPKARARFEMDRFMGMDGLTGE